VLITLAILVPIDGVPVIKPVPGNARFNRVINTRALILQGGLEQNFYIHVYDGWLSASTIGGPWTQPFRQPFGMDDLGQQLASGGKVDMLSGGANANPKPSLANGVPTIYTTQVPTELLVFNGHDGEWLATLAEADGSVSLYHIDVLTGKASSRGKLPAGTVVIDIAVPLYQD